eukprot:jgi/Bigna1/69276/fgenesh1_pg.8_\
MCQRSLPKTAPLLCNQWPCRFPLRHGLSWCSQTIPAAHGAGPGPEKLSQNPPIGNVTIQLSNFGTSMMQNDIDVIPGRPYEENAGSTDWGRQGLFSYGSSSGSGSGSSSSSSSRHGFAVKASVSRACPSSRCGQSVIVLDPGDSNATSISTTHKEEEDEEIEPPFVPLPVKRRIRIIQSLDGHLHPVTKTRFTPSRVVLETGDTGRISVPSLASGDANPRSSSSFFLSFVLPAGAAAKGTILVWDLSEGEPIIHIPPPRNIDSSLDTRAGGEADTGGGGSGGRMTSRPLNMLLSSTGLGLFSRQHQQRRDKLSTATRDVSLAVSGIEWHPKYHDRLIAIYDDGVVAFWALNNNNSGNEKEEKGGGGDRSDSKNGGRTVSRQQQKRGLCSVGFEAFGKHHYRLCVANKNGYLLDDSKKEDNSNQPNIDSKFRIRMSATTHGGGRGGGGVGSGGGREDSKARNTSSATTVSAKDASPSQANQELIKAFFCPFEEGCVALFYSRRICLFDANSNRTLASSQLLPQNIRTHGNITDAQAVEPYRRIFATFHTLPYVTLWGVSKIDNAKKQQQQQKASWRIRLLQTIPLISPQLRSTLGDLSGVSLRPRVPGIPGSVGAALPLSRIVVDICGVSGKGDVLTWAATWHDMGRRTTRRTTRNGEEEQEEEEEEDDEDEEEKGDGGAGNLNEFEKERQGLCRVSLRSRVKRLLSSLWSDDGGNTTKSKEGRNNKEKKEKQHHSMRVALGTKCGEILIVSAATAEVIKRFQVISPHPHASSSASSSSSSSFGVSGKTAASSSSSSSSGGASSLDCSSTVQGVEWVSEDYLTFFTSQALSKSGSSRTRYRNRLGLLHVRSGALRYVKNSTDAGPIRSATLSPSRSYLLLIFDGLAAQIVDIKVALARTDISKGVRFSIGIPVVAGAFISFSREVKTEADIEDTLGIKLNPSPSNSAKQDKSAKKKDDMTAVAVTPSQQGSKHTKGEEKIEGGGGEQAAPLVVACDNKHNKDISKFKKPTINPLVTDGGGGERNGSSSTSSPPLDFAFFVVVTQEGVVHLLGIGGRKRRTLHSFPRLFECKEGMIGDLDKISNGVRGLGFLARRKTKKKQEQDRRSPLITSIAAKDGYIALGEILILVPKTSTLTLKTPPRSVAGGSSPKQAKPKDVQVVGAVPRELFKVIRPTPAFASTRHHHHHRQQHGAAFHRNDGMTKTPSSVTYLSFTPSPYLYHVLKTDASGRYDIYDAETGGRISANPNSDPLLKALSMGRCSTDSSNLPPSTTGNSSSSSSSSKRNNKQNRGRVLGEDDDDDRLRHPPLDPNYTAAYHRGCSSQHIAWFGVSGTQVIACETGGTGIRILDVSLSLFNSPFDHRLLMHDSAVMRSRGGQAKDEEEEGSMAIDGRKEHSDPRGFLDGAMTTLRASLRNDVLYCLHLPNSSRLLYPENEDGAEHDGDDDKDGEDAVNTDGASDSCAAKLREHTGETKRRGRRGEKANWRETQFREKSLNKQQQPLDPRVLPCLLPHKDQEILYLMLALANIGASRGERGGGALLEKSAKKKNTTISKTGTTRSLHSPSSSSSAAASYTTTKSKGLLKQTICASFRTFRQIFRDTGEGGSSDGDYHKNDDDNDAAKADFEGKGQDRREKDRNMGLRLARSW